MSQTERKEFEHYEEACEILDAFREDRVDDFFQKLDNLANNGWGSNLTQAGRERAASEYGDFLDFDEKRARRLDIPSRRDKER